MRNDVWPAGRFDRFLGGLPHPLNLHVSAQLGEWRADDPESAAKAPTDALWNESPGWGSNSNTKAWVKGKDGEMKEIWARPKAREMQLSKARFGRGEWKAHLKLSSVYNGDPRMATVLFPSKDGESWDFTVD